MLTRGDLHFSFMFVCVFFFFQSCTWFKQQSPWSFANEFCQLHWSAIKGCEFMPELIKQSKFPAQGHCIFLHSCCSVVCYLAPEISPGLLCNCEWDLFQFFLSGRMGVCLFWPFEPLERTHPEKEACSLFMLILWWPEKPTWWDK